jgi:hypothetical protein
MQFFIRKCLIRITYSPLRRQFLRKLSRVSPRLAELQGEDQGAKVGRQRTCGGYSESETTWVIVLLTLAGMCGCSMITHWR